MYEYSEEAILLPPNTPSDVEIQLDNIRITYPVVPRICARQAYFFIWFSDKQTDPELYQDSQRSKYDSQWVHCKNKEHIEKGVVMVHIYEDEIIIGENKFTYNLVLEQAKIFMQEKLTCYSIIETHEDSESNSNNDSDNEKENYYKESLDGSKQNFF